MIQHGEAHIDLKISRHITPLTKTKIALYQVYTKGRILYLYGILFTTRFGSYHLKCLKNYLYVIESQSHTY